MTTTDTQINNEGNEQKKTGSTYHITRMTPYDKINYDMNNDPRFVKEVTLGKRIGFYRIRGELGSGNFSQVKMGVHSLTKEKVAIKILDKTKLDAKTQRLLSREISSMERLHHPNIIRLYEVVETLAKLHMVMEFANGGELFGKISNEGKLSEIEAKSLFAQIAAGIQHMHDNHIIHRDLKAENVFFSGQHIVKIGDFGFSTFSRPDQVLNTFCGSPPYAAPELFKDEHYYGQYVDIWAMGIMLYFMVTGVMPFRAETVSKLKRCILDGSYSIPSYVNENCQYIIRGILKAKPQERLTIDQMKKCEWLESQKFPQALEKYDLHLSDSNSSLNEEEIESRKVLKDLGITEEIMRNSSGKDSRNNITGTYRIVLHKIHKRNTNEISENVDNAANNNPSSVQSNTGYALKKQQSKMCTIL